MVDPAAARGSAWINVRRRMGSPRRDQVLKAKGHRLSERTYAQKCNNQERLEDEFPADLKLTRRSAVTGGKASRSDLAEGRRLHVAGGLAEVGVIEDVEGVDAQVETKMLADQLCILL